MPDEPDTVHSLSWQIETLWRQGKRGSREEERLWERLRQVWWQTWARREQERQDFYDRLHGTGR